MEDQERKFEGCWWLPSAPSVQWDGILSWKPTKSPRLTLKYRSVGEPEPPTDAEAILGVDEGGTPITVLRVGWSGGVHAGFLSRKDYIAGHILRGIHVDSLNGFRANRVDFWLQNSGSWLNEEGFHDSSSSWQLKYDRPPDRSFQISRDTTIKICHSSRGSAANRRRSIEYDIFFSVEKARPFDFARAWKWLDALRALLHFACLRKIHATAVRFENFAHTFPLAGASYPKELEFFTGGIHAPPQRDLHLPDFVFRFDTVANRFTELVKEWFKFCAEQREALRCYTTTVYTSPPCEVKLICLTQALEAFHQRRFKPNSEREDVNFVNRIRHLCDRHSDTMIPIVGDLKRFASSVRDTRHYYTHHDPDIRRMGNVASGTPLTMMTYHLQFLFRLCVLTEFGLAADPHSVLRRQIPGRVIEYF
jgi:hypothetical protein